MIVSLKFLDPEDPVTEVPELSADKKPLNARPTIDSLQLWKVEPEIDPLEELQKSISTTTIREDLPEEVVLGALEVAEVVEDLDVAEEVAEEEVEEEVRRYTNLFVMDLIYQQKLL